MLMVCPSCSKSFEVAGHLEAEAAHKCPACGYGFGKEQEPPQPPRPRKATARLPVHRKTGLARRKTKLIVKKEPARGPRLPGSVELDKCELGEELSRGGAGILYGARDTASGLEIVIKAFLEPPGSEAGESTRWEASSKEAMKLRHPRLVRVLGVGLMEKVPCAAIERVDGENFEKGLRRRPGQLKFGAQVVLGILEGLEAAHAAGIVHGNVKPSNILVDSDGKGRLTDSGHSPRVLASDGSVVDSEHVRSSLPYVAPEQLVSGPEAASKAADIYSVGAVLYRLAVGKVPFSDLSPEEQAEAIREGRLRPPKPPSRLVYELESIALHAMAKEPAERYPSVRGLAADLRRFMGGGQLHAVESRKRGRRALKALMWVVLLAGLASSSYYAYSDWRTRKAETGARAFLSQARQCAREGETGEVERLLNEALELPTKKFTRALLHTELGSCLLTLERYGEARDEFQAAAQKGPQALRAKAMAAVARALGGAPEEALEELLLLSADASVADSIVEVAGRLAARGDAAMAARFYEAFLESGASRPDRANALVAYAGMKIARGSPEEARGLVLKAVRLDAGSRPRAALALAEAAPLDLSGEENKLLLGSPEAMIALAENHKNAGRTREAGEWLARAVPATEDARLLSRAFAALGELSELAGDLRAAEARFRRAVDEASADETATARARLGLARLELRRGKAAAALPALKELAERLPAPQAAEARLLAAFCLRATGVPSEAAKLYEKVAAAETPGPELRSRALLGHGEALLESGGRTEAARFLTEAVREAPAGSASRQIARFLAGGLEAGDLDRTSQSRPRDERAHALYAIGLALTLADDPGARDAYSRCIEASKGVSWYRLVARSRSR